MVVGSRTSDLCGARGDCARMDETRKTLKGRKDMGKTIKMLFPQGKDKALTLSYDDGTIHDRKLIDILNTYHIKATFNLNSGILSRIGTENLKGRIVDMSTVTRDEIISLSTGPEIASHTANHSSLPTLPTANIA